MEHLLLLLGVPEDRFGSGEVGATTDVLRAYEILDEHGALVIGAHVNSTHGIAMQGLRFGGQTKIAYTQDPHLHALEVTDLLPTTNRRSTARFFSGTKSEYPRRMHCIQGSDAHRLEQDPARETNLGIGDRPTEVLLAETSFAALKALLTSDDFDRVRAFTAPPSDPVKAARLEGNTAHQVFHESAGSKRGQSAILRDVVAFANSGGGRVYLGVSASEKRPIAGLNDAKAVVAELSRDIAAQITPPVAVTFEELLSDGKPVVVLHVAEGAHKPHAVAPGGIFVRRDTESAQATRDEIVQMVTGAAATAPVAAAATPVVATPAPANGRARREPAKRTGAAPERQARPETRVQARVVAPAAADRGTDGRADLNGSATPEPESPAAAPAADLPEIYEETVGADPVAPTTGIEVLESYRAGRDPLLHPARPALSQADPQRHQDHRPPDVAHRDRPAGKRRPRRNGRPLEGRLWSLAIVPAAIGRPPLRPRLSRRWRSAHLLRGQRVGDGRPLEGSPPPGEGHRLMHARRARPR